MRQGHWRQNRRRGSTEGSTRRERLARAAGALPVWQLNRNTVSSKYGPAWCADKRYYGINKNATRSECEWMCRQTLRHFIHCLFNTYLDATLNTFQQLIIGRSRRLAILLIGNNIMLWDNMWTKIDCQVCWHCPLRILIVDGQLMNRPTGRRH